MTSYIRSLFAAALLLVAVTVQAQSPSQGLWVTPGTDGWNIVHTVRKGETVFQLARRYHVPPAILADANGLTYSDGLRENTSVSVPLGAYNLQSEKPANTADAKPLYYKVRPEDNLYRISRHTNVPQRTLAQWNNLGNSDVRNGQTLLVGWVLYDATNISPAAPQEAHPPARQVIQRPLPVARPDTPKYVLQEPVTTSEPDNADSTAVTPPPANGIESVFREQTLDGQNIVFEKGTAAFFSLKGQAKGASVFAFHNKASRGAVIRVKNINNGRIVYVKVLGPLPMTKQYYNCVIGLSGAAKAALGVRDERAFCELSYAGY